MRKAIQRALSESTDGWNRADLERFLAVYQDGRDTTLITGGKVIQGLVAIRRYYARRFVSGKPGAAGTLAIDLSHVRRFGESHCLVIGRYRLAGAESGKTSRGLLTLIFQRGPAGWRIVSDHSS